MSNVSRLVEIYIDFGLARSTALILAVLTFYAINKYVSMKDLARLTGLSKSSLSIRLRDLVNMGIVESRRWGKSKLYRLRRDGITNLLKNRIMEFFKRVEMLADSLNDVVLRNDLKRFDLNIKELLDKV
ncbi:MAG: helix-turn-helix domain-containing protein [Desulfurococcaceae archaeon]|uniref:Transcriptional regulator n=1 Tax=Staphylothermus marinus TaxID=2280 RepID=A0A7C4NN07_STAMA